MIRVELIDHIVLRTTRPQLLIDFYRDVLGCAAERTLPPEAGLVQLRAGKALIDIVDVNSELGKAGGPAPQTTGNNLDHYCLQVAGTEEALLDDLLEHGIDAGKPEERYGASGFGPSVYIADPDGNVIELRPQIN